MRGHQAKNQFAGLMSSPLAIKKIQPLLFMACFDIIEVEFIAQIWKYNFSLGHNPTKRQNIVLLKIV